MATRLMIQEPGKAPRPYVFESPSNPGSFVSMGTSPVLAPASIANPTAVQTAPVPAFGSSISERILNPLLTKLQGIPRQVVPFSQPLAPKFANQAPVPLKRPEPEFFQNLFAQRVSPVEEEFFGGPASVSSQAIGEANRRGFMTAGPSGVAGQLYKATVTEPFLRRTADIQNEVNILKSEMDLQMQQFDVQRQDQFKTFLADLESRDRAFGIERATAQSNIDTNFLQLEGQIREAMARGSTQEELARLEREVQLYEIGTRAKLAERQLIAETYLRGAEIPGFLEPGFFPFDPLGFPRPSGISTEESSPEPRGGQRLGNRGGFYSSNGSYNGEVRNFNGEWKRWYEDSRGGRWIAA